MTEVEIEYCVPCGHRSRAIDVQEAVLDEFGRDVDRVALNTGTGGVFKIRVDGDVVYDKAEDGYDLDAIVDAVRDRHSATA
ncbi:selenoprotein [Halobacteriales archaeon QS_1_68_20]|nr:MAG: selenoprotein [Halobacteriales archaeon QS_1_68_20]